MMKNSYENNDRKKDIKNTTYERGKEIAEVEIMKRQSWKRIVRGEMKRKIEEILQKGNGRKNKFKSNNSR